MNSHWVLCVLSVPISAHDFFLAWRSSTLEVMHKFKFNLLAHGYITASKQNVPTSTQIWWSARYLEALRPEAFILDTRKPLVSKYFRMQVRNSLLCFYMWDTCDMNTTWITIIHITNWQTISQQRVRWAGISEPRVPARPLPLIVGSGAGRSPCLESPGSGS